MKYGFCMYLILLSCVSPALAKSIGADCGVLKEKIKYDLLMSTSPDKHESVKSDLEIMKNICFEVAENNNLDVEAKKSECSTVAELDLSSICYLELADYIVKSVPWF